MGAAESAAVRPPRDDTTAKRRTMKIAHKAEVSADLDVDFVISIAERAGKAIMNVYEGDNWDVDHKADDSPLTRADKEANQIICDALQEWTPHIPIISEENKLVPYSVRKNYQYCWVVDPLDGTKEFIKRVPHFTVNIALVKGQSPVLGVVYTPAAATTHFAVKGQGAYVRSPGADDQLVGCADYDPAAESLTIVGSASHMTPLTQEFLSQYPSHNLTQIGSSLKFLLVAEGLAHCYPRLAPTCEWDTAAAHVIVEEAGGSIVAAGKCDNKGVPLENWREESAKEKPVIYNKEDMLNPFFIVYGRRRNPETENSEKTADPPTEDAARGK